MGSNKIVKTKLSHKSQKEQNKGKIKGKIILHMVQCKVITKAQQIKKYQKNKINFKQLSKKKQINLNYTQTMKIRTEVDIKEA